MKYYAGIGSRDAPTEVLRAFENIAEQLALEGFILRSGGAKGADKAFETGCDRVGGQKEIFLPWRGFEGSTSNLVVCNNRAFEIAKRFHPNWYNMTFGGQKLQARNSHQVLGWDLETPSSFIICWTMNGSGRGGTGQAIRIAKHYNIPVFDAGSYACVEKMMEELKELIYQIK